MSFPHNFNDLENEVVKGVVPFSIHKLSGFVDVVTATDFVNPVDPVLSLEYIDPQGNTCAKSILPLSTYIAFLVQNFRIEVGNAKLPKGNNNLIGNYGFSVGGTLVKRSGHVAAMERFYGCGYWNDGKKCTCGCETAFKGEPNITEMHSPWCDLYIVPKHNNRKCDCGNEEKHPEIHPDYISHKLTCPAHKG